MWGYSGRSVSANKRLSKRKARATEAALMLWFKPFYEAVSLPKLNGVAIKGDFCEPPRLSHQSSGYQPD